jgi:LuxR family transcriptional regulator, maltose regulon positive regulatory protein
MAPILQWLETLPQAAMDARPSLWVTFASVLMLSGRPNSVEDKLLAAEAALRHGELDERRRDLEGHMAVVRALVAASQNQVDTLRAETQRAMELLSQGNLATRTFNTFAQGLACQLQGDLEGALGFYIEAISACHASGYSTLAAAAACSLGQVQEAGNQLHAAADAYRRMLQLLGDPAHIYNHGAHQGLARISYEWNDLEAALQHCEQCVHLAPLIECISPASSQVMLARILLARSDAAGAAAVLEQAAEAARRHRFEDLRPEVAAAQVLVLLRQGKIAAAARLAEQYNLPMSRARVRLAQGNPAEAGPPDLGGGLPGDGCRAGRGRGMGGLGRHRGRR